MTLKSNIKGKDLVAENVHRAIQAKKLLKRSTNQKLGRITVSFNIAAFRPLGTAGSLIERADRCLYAAKHAGRNQVINGHELVNAITPTKSLGASAA
ncbi:MAG: diguanylate cyclase [Candidatus Devosia symbiotica]|nr:diguanylate cyclase [Candidatus Devosia symbiotica]